MNAAQDFARARSLLSEALDVLPVDVLQSLLREESSRRGAVVDPMKLTFPTRGNRR